ncbi:MAG: HEAT repeat domain-containing protein [Thermodesulfobacteriota bacterium]
MKHVYNKDGSIVLKGVSRVLNVCGKTVVYSYDVCASGVGKICGVAKKTSGATKRLGWSSQNVVRARESVELIKKIEKDEQRLNALYHELGRSSVEVTAGENPSTSEKVQSLLTEIKELRLKNDQLKERVVEQEKRKKANLLLKEELKEYAQRTGHSSRKHRKDKPKILDAVRRAIADALEQDTFSNGTDRVTFQIIAGDLLDHEMEIKVLAAAELGKIKCKAAVNVLNEALRFDDPKLTMEIISALTAIGDYRAVPVFLEHLSHPSHHVRKEALTGFCTWAEDKDEVMLSLLEALQDPHPAVRTTSVTLLGWRKEKETLPTLMVCTQDRDERVRKAAISALAHSGDKSALLVLADLLGDKSHDIRERALGAIREISGEYVAFDLQAKGEELREAIEGMKYWFHQTEVSNKSAEMGYNEIPEQTEPAKESSVHVPQEMPVEEFLAETETQAVSAGDPTEDIVIREMFNKDEPLEDQSVPAPPVEPEIPGLHLTEGVESHPPPEIVPSRDKLEKMVKPQLLSLCENLNIEYDFLDTKEEIIVRLLESPSQ